MIKFFSLLFLLASFSIQAGIKELASGLTVDTGKSIQKLEPCGPNVPGEVCLIQCYNVNNQTTSTWYTCNLQATANFDELVKTQNGYDLYTGNTLVATDFRTLTIYPYQTASICFNYGKEVVAAPDQDDAMWVYSSSTIDAVLAPNSGAGPCLHGTVGESPTTSTPTELF